MGVIVAGFQLWLDWSRGLTPKDQGTYIGLNLYGIGSFTGHQTEIMLVLELAEAGLEDSHVERIRGQLYTQYKDGYMTEKRRSSSDCMTLEFGSQQTAEANRGSAARTSVKSTC